MSHTPDEFLSPNNLDKLRLPDSNRSITPKPMILGQFLRGPIPLDWLTRAAHLPGKSPLAVALAIRFESGRQRDSATVKVTNPLVAKFGVSRKAKYSALAALEGAGLIVLDRRPKRSPLATIIEH